MAKRDDVHDIDEIRERYRNRDFLLRRGRLLPAAEARALLAQRDAAWAEREAQVARRAREAEAARTLPWQRAPLPDPATRPDRPSVLSGLGAAGTTAAGRVLGRSAGAEGMSGGEVVILVAGVAGLFAAAVYVGVRLRRWWEGRGRAATSASG